VRPYLFAGAGAMLFDKNIDVDEKKMDYIAPSGGGGINFRLGPSVMLNLQETFYYSTGDTRDGAVSNENDAYLLHMAGLSFNFGKKRDADHDGVSDYRDKCPNTPALIAVDKVGCPLDKDGDAVADYLDDCPDIAGTKELKGCPDLDGDGVADKDDLCVDLKGLIALSGCPDQDSDGIADKDDRCPGDAGFAALKGCPDIDKDGVADLDDRCPNTKSGYKVDAMGCPMDNDKDGIVNEDDACPDNAGIPVFKGCPDKDGDGVADNQDRCPDVKGTIANKGCPEMAKADVKKITQIASKIFFETNSDKLKVASLAQLDELAGILKRYEAANLLIEGHADSQGEDAYNLTLSQKRTESVKTYLMGRGIMESRLTAMGFGESRPIADNATSLGRAKNRRVELKTSY
jgi:OOP family OmpA-OmpF porin